MTQADSVSAVILLLRRIGASRGNPTLKDCAMASILASAIDRRKVGRAPARPTGVVALAARANEAEKRQM